MNISILLLLAGINMSPTNDWLPSERIGNATYEIIFEKCEEESIYNGRTKNAFSLGIVNRVSQKKSHIQFSAYADSLRDATIAFHDYFTFNAHSQFNYVGLQYIIDMNKEKIIDVLPNQGIWFSPSQRFIVYQSGYPTVALPDYKKSFLYIYDLSRVYDEKPIRNDNNQFPPAVVGYPLYPEEYAITQKVDISPDAGLLSPILWNEKENRLVFISFNEYNSYNSIVCVDIRKGLDRPAYYTKIIEEESIFILKKMTEWNKKESYKNKNNPFYLTTEKIEWAGENRIRIFPDRKESWLKRYYEFDLPEDFSLEK